VFRVSQSLAVMHCHESIISDLADYHQQTVTVAEPNKASSL